MQQSTYMPRPSSPEQIVPIVSGNARTGFFIHCRTNGTIGPFWSREAATARAVQLAAGEAIL